MLKLTLLLIFLTPLTIYAQEQKKEPEPERLFCTVIQVEPFATLECADGEGNQLSLKPLRAPAGLSLDKKHLNPEVSTVILERTSDKLCIVQVNVMGGWVKEAVNQVHECVEPRKKSNHRKRAK